MNRVSLALVGFAAVSALALTACGSDTAPQPTVTVTAPAPVPPTTTTPTPTTPTDADVYATWVQAGGANAVDAVITTANAATNASSCSAIDPILTQLINEAQRVIDFQPQPPASVRTPLNAAMVHLQNSARAEATYCQSPAGSAAEAAAQAKANSELVAAKADLTKASAAAALYNNTGSAV